MKIHHAEVNMCDVYIDSENEWERETTDKNMQPCKQKRQHT